MKKLFISFVLLFSLFIFSQEYQFDYMLKSTVKRENPDYNYQSYDMVNSKNHNLYMEVGRNNINHNYYSILVDNDKKIVSRFNLTDVNKNPIHFKYERGYNIFDDINDTLAPDYRKTIPMGIGKIDEALHELFGEKYQLMLSEREK